MIKVIIILLVISQVLVVINNILIKKKIEKMTTETHKTGEWISEDIISTDTNTYTAYRCSKCGYLSHGATRYCPNCGVKMNTEED